MDGSRTAGFVVGALYNRRQDIHAHLGGQWQSGIATPSGSPFVIAFTSVAGLRHGYLDDWNADGTFRYFGEGQVGDMRLERGNLALYEHERNHKRLLLFQALGGGVHRFLGEFRCADFDLVPGVPDRDGRPRTAIVFRLQPLHDEVGEALAASPPFYPDDSDRFDATVKQVLTTVRTKQALFRRRLTTIERGCRITRVCDLRFLRASHIKPWAESDNTERVDRNNGLLLTPSADLLFDHGWISFRDDGRLLVAPDLPDEVERKVGLDLRPGRDCGAFNDDQARFLAYHRDCVYDDPAHRDRLDLELYR